MTMTFDGASQSPAYAELMEHQPDLGSYVFWDVLGIVLCVAATGGCLYGFTVLSDVGALLCGIGAGVMALMSIFAVRGYLRFKAAPLERLLARVKDETVETSVTTTTTHDRRTGRARTRTRTNHEYFLLLEFEDGERESFEVDEETARLTVKGDVGVAYLKGGVLLDFRPIGDGQ